MSANAMASPSQQARSTHPQQAPASGGGKHRAAEDGHQFVFKPFKISKEATSAQRRAQRQDHVGATDPRKEEFARKWCSYDPFKPIWRPPEPRERPAAAKRKAREDAEQAAAEEAGFPRHLELDRWLRHIVMSRRREEEERKDKARLERQRRKEEKDGKGKDAMSDGEEDTSEPAEDERGKTLQERLLQAQIDCRETGNGSGHERDDEGDGSSAAVRKIDGWGGVDGVRCRLHSADRLQGLKPGVFVNLFPGGFSVEGETSGRLYDMDSKEFLAGLDRGKIPARKLLELSGHSNFVYTDGCLVAEVRDYRMPRSVDQKPAVWLMALEPDSGVVAQDLSTVAESHQNLSSDDLLLVEKRMLLVTQPSVCLSPHPHVATVASSLQRRANRMGVWHARSTRSSVSQFRRTFDAGAMRRLHAAVHVSDTSGLDPVPTSLAVSSHVPSLAALSKYSEGDSMGEDGDCAELPKPTCTGMWKGNKLLEGWDLDGDGKNGAVLMATALRQLKASARKDVDKILPGAKSSHGLIGVKKDGRGEKSADGSERGLPRNYFLPRQYLRDGMPPERQMRFRKDNQVVTIAIEKKDASTYQLRSWLHEFGQDGKALENSQVVMPPQVVGNSSQARLFGGQLFGVYHKEGWQCTGDSHQPSRAKTGASGGSAQGAASNSERSAARAGGQAPQGNSRVAASAANAAAGRGVSPAGRGGMVAGGYANNGQTAVRPAAPKAKQAPHAAAHPPVASPHMMAGRAAPVHGAMPPGAAPAGQQRAPMGHPGAVPAQQQYMQQGYRPPVGMHQAPPQQHHAHQVPPAHPAHAAQGVQYHAAAGRGYMPHTHHPQVAGRGVAPGQPVARPAVSNVQAAVSAAQHQVYKPPPPHATHAIPQQQQQPPPTQPVQAGMPMSAPMQHAAMAAGGGVAMAHRPAQPGQVAAKPPVVSPTATAGRGQAPPPQAPPVQHHPYQHQQPPKANQ